jgi:general stress protein YciG
VKKKKRGFATMDPTKRKLIASMGGKSVTPEKRSFAPDPELASRAGTEGGKNVPPRERAFSRDKTLAAAAGRKGGSARGKSKTPEFVR